MRKHPHPFLSFILVATLAFAVSCNSERITDKKEDLGRVIINYYESLAKKDMDAIGKVTAKNFVLFDDGTIYSNESALAMVSGLPEFTATFKLDSVNAHIDKENASMYYIREAQFTMADSIYSPVKFLESATFMKVDGEWRIRFIHSSVMK